MISGAFADNLDEWRNYIDGTIGKPRYYLFEQTLNMFFANQKTYRAMDLGSGAGNEDIQLVAKGWDVTGIDKSPRSGEVIAMRSNNLRGHFHFQQTDFSGITWNGSYDLVMSFYSLPFGDKTNLPIILKNISQHMQRNGVFAANFFGYEQTFVKNKIAYGVTQAELKNYLNNNHFEVKFLLQRIYDQNDFSGQPTHWEVFDVIAVKK